MDLHPVELPDGVSAVRTAVDDVLTSVHTEWDQTTAQPQPAQKEQVQLIEMTEKQVAKSSAPFFIINFFSQTFVGNKAES